MSNLLPEDREWGVASGERIVYTVGKHFCLVRIHVRRGVHFSSVNQRATEVDAF